MKKHGFRYCKTCTDKLQKWGKTTAGVQRWRCVNCLSTATRKRSDLSRGYILEEFVSWLLGKNTQDDLGDRRFRDKTKWCWEITPPFVFTGEIHHALIVDGINVGGKACLIARTTEYVVAWAWVQSENAENWSKLFSILPPPKYLVCDGQKGLLGAAKSCWPNTVIQRCRFHIWLQHKPRLTGRFRSQDSKEMTVLVSSLMHARGRKQARIWKKQLRKWRQRYWRNADLEAKSICRQLYKLQDDLLRSSYRPDPRLPSTTNHMEGGVNSSIRRILSNHRGMPLNHQMRAVDWYLYSRTEAPKPTRKCL
jgi:hypothetical protein